ncbi:MAG: hypothetical protein GX971_05745 [Firmicutes bacterium]|nr:hypothetical protein [Bacillota bacterium]
MIKWRTLSRKDAEDIFTQWTDHPIVDCEHDYQSLRAELLSSIMDPGRESAAGLESTGLGYEFDLSFGLILYEALGKGHGFSPRLASDDGIWRYLSIKVVPDIVVRRNGLKPGRFYKEPRRIWLKVVWWYIHLSWQGTGADTYEVLKNNSTDHIVQLVERPGSHGYRVDLTRTLMREYHYLMESHKVDAKGLFRKVMVLNTARLKVVEPSLCIGQETGYVKELFSYFGYSDEKAIGKVAESDRPVFGLRRAISGISGGRI